MSFREKCAWIELTAYTIVFGAYFFSVWGAWNASGGRQLIMGLTIGAIVALAIIAVALTTVVAIFNPKEANAPADERETLIDLKSERIAFYVLTIGVVCLIGALLIGWDGLIVAISLQSVLVIAEVVKTITQIAHYRAAV